MSRAGDVLLGVGSCLVALAAGELAARALVVRPLPPLQIIKPSAPPAGPQEQAPFKDLLVGGKRITVGDLVGYARPDPLLVYTIKENTVSVNGWWQSNNIGARSRTDTNPEIPSGKRRFLLFGESFGAATRVPQEDGWPSLVEASVLRLEVVNLAVDGYSMAQAYLRYLSLKERIRHNGALMMFAPSADLWREVNTMRELAFDWKAQVVHPRYVVEQGRLKLIPAPYADQAELFRDNRERLSDRLREHLVRYDRFYFQSLYESPPLVGNLWLYRLAASSYGGRAKAAMLREVLLPGAEATLVSREIFRAMQAQAAALQARFAVIIIPTTYDLAQFRDDPPSFKAWQALVEFMCAGIDRCIDLTAALREIPTAEIDAGYDGSHYGPNVNRRIAEVVAADLS